MAKPVVITRVEIRLEQDVVRARQRARLIAGLLGFDRNDQARIATAVSEIARNCHQYGGGGEAEFRIEGEAKPQLFVILVRDTGPGIKDLEEVLEGHQASPVAAGRGLSGARRLIDVFKVETGPGKGTTVYLGKVFPPGAPEVDAQQLGRIAEALERTRSESPAEEVRLQNRDLLHALEALQQRQEELLQLNRELEDTNRGVLALYSELDEKAAQLKRANEMKAQFLSNMSHEFRTPLNSTLAISRLLLDRENGELTAEQEKQVTFIRTSAEDLSVLVNDLLDLARIEAGRGVVRSRPYTVREIFSGLRGMFKPMLGNSALRVEFEEPEGLPPLETDDGKISQILRNFLSNAFKFTEQGEIRVSARLADDGTAVSFSVSDTGMGIASEDQTRIFEDFAQVELAQVGKARGTGLGLPICRRLAGMLGGHVSVESRLGVGSTFSAVIPIRHAEPRGEEAPAPVVDRSRRTVLVVEDDAATRMLYEKYLSGSGYQALSAPSIADGRRILGHVKPAAIVLDLVLPGEDAWGFLAELKKNEATREIPVIIASVLEEDAKGFALGVDDYCVKPVERAWLLERLQHLSRGKGGNKVLIIDDEEVARYVLKGLLAESRFVVLEAGDGPAGLRLAEEEMPSVIFLDLTMPGMSGFEVLRHLKENPFTRGIPVIVSTSKVLDEQERLDLSAQVQAVISKGAHSREAAFDTIREALRHALDARPSEGELPS